MINEQLIKEFERDRKDYGKNLILVKANPDKGFNYPFYLYIPPVDPSKMKTSIIMDCLNDYEEELPEGMRENSKAIETVYRMLSNNTVIEASENGANTNNSDVQEEEESKSLERMLDRMARAMGPINRFSHVEGFPVMVPIIPGFMGTKVEVVNQVKSQLDKDVIEELAPQIKKMYEYARKIIKVKVKVEPGKPKMEINGIINFGYSKSSDFASNFMAYYPELCKGGFFGCGSLGTLPLDSITLKVVKDESKNPNPLFYKGENGEIIKEVTQEEYNRIKEEYKKEKREHQKDIVDGEEEGTHIVPLNFPLGIADIEHYRTDLSKVVERDEAGNVVKRGKEAYRELLAKIQTKIFVSEYEESRTGTYAYMDTPAKDGRVIQAGTDMEEELKKEAELKKKEIDCPTDWIEFQKKLADNNLGNVELAGMSNRILESINLVNAVFGRSVNERFHSYRQLYELIGANVQTRIYKGFNHYNESFYTIREGEGRILVFASQNLWQNKLFRKNLSDTFGSFDKGDNLQLDDTGTIEEVSPVFQLCRRYLANGGNIQALVGLEVADLNELFNDLAKKKLDKEPKVRKGRVFDELTSDEIKNVIIIAREAAKGKVGIEDVSDSDVRSGEASDATKYTMNAQQIELPKDTIIPETE